MDHDIFQFKLEPSKRPASRTKKWSQDKIATEPDMAVRSRDEGEPRAVSIWKQVATSQIVVICGSTAFCVTARCMQARQ